MGLFRMPENLRIALGGILGNRLRSALTILGILIGTSSVILLLAVGAGAGNYVKKEIAEMGTNTITVSQGFGTAKQSGNSGSGSGGGQTVTFTAKQLEALRKLDHVKYAVPIVQGSGDVSFGAKSAQSSSVVGTEPHYRQMLPTSFQAGVMFNDDDVKQHRRVAVLGANVAGKLFPGQSPVGKRINVGGHSFEVTGVMTKRGGIAGAESDGKVVVPYTAAMETLSAPSNGFSQLMIKPTSLTDGSAAVGEIRATLAMMTPESSAGMYDVFDSRQFAKSSEGITRSLTLLLGAIASISLLVGGIGVMNIMLVTVTERTREIGLRKALGARRGTIVSQFLIEAVVLSAMGGILGILVGVGLAQLKLGSFTTDVQPYSIVLAFGVSLLTGIFFGFYPAQRAAKLRPIDALRYE